MKILYLFRRKVFFSLSLAVVMALLVFTSIALADKISTDGDVLTTSPNVSVTTCTTTQTFSGSATIDYQGSQHFVSTGGTLNITYSADSPVTVTGPATITLPSGWNSSADTYTFTGIQTTIPAGIANGTYKVTVTVDGPKQGGETYTINDFFNVDVNCSTADTTPPVVTVSFPKPTGLNGWFNTSPVVGSVVANDSSTVTSISCTDSASGLTQGALVGGGTSSASQTLTFSGEGTHNISCTATDGASNSGAAAGSSNTATIMIDTVAPTLTLVFTPDIPDGNSGWWKTPGGVPFAWTCSDGTSGINPAFGGGCPSPLSGTETAQGITNFSDRVRDMAGNLSVTVNRDLKLDNVAPTIDCSVPDQTIWYGSNVNVSCTASDSVSKLANPADASFTLSTSVASGNEIASATTGSKTVSDGAGNSSSVGPYTFLVDWKGPAITISSPTAINYLLNQAVAASYGCTDGGSGVASCAGPVADGSNIDTSSVGPKNFTVNATDNVGNSAFVNVP